MTSTAAGSGFLRLLQLPGCTPLIMSSTPTGNTAPFPHKSPEMLLEKRSTARDCSQRTVNTPQS